MKIQAQVYTIGESRNRTTKVLASGIEIAEGILIIKTLVKAYLLTGWFCTSCDPTIITHIEMEQGIVMENYSGERMTIKLIK